MKAESTTESKATVKAKVDGGSGDTLGFGASIGFEIDDVTTSARVDNGAGVTNAKGVDVSAITTDTMTNEVEGGTGGGKAATVVVAASIPNVTTNASVGTGALLLLLGSGAFNVAATQTAKSTSKAKGAAKGNISVGAALAFNMPDNSVSASLNRSVSGAGSVTVAAAGQSESLAESHASAEGAKKADDPQAPKVDQQSQDQRNKADGTAADNAARNSGSKPTPQAKTKDGNNNTVKVSVAAAISINMATTSSSASIGDGAIITSTGLVKVSSSANTDAKATSEGEAKIADADKCSGSCPSFAIGVAVSVNDVDMTNQASIGTGGSITGSAITIEAVMKDVSGDKQHKFEAEATSGASDGKVGIAGAFAADFIGSTTSATGKGSLTTTGGDLKVTAANDELVDAKATAKVLTAKTVGVGASISINEQTNTVHASLDGATVNAVGAATLDANSKSEIKSRTLSGAIAKDDGSKQSASTDNNGGGLHGAGAGAGSENSITNTVLADIVGGSNVTATSVSLTAKDDSDIQAIAGDHRGGLRKVGRDLGHIGARARGEHRHQLDHEHRARRCGQLDRHLIRGRRTDSGGEGAHPRGDDRGRGFSDFEQERWRRKWWLHLRGCGVGLREHDQHDRRGAHPQREPRLLGADITPTPRTSPTSAPMVAARPVPPSGSAGRSASAP